MTDSVVVVTNSSSNIIEIISAGPQGAQGPQGVKGDVGDVNPEMYTLRDQAAASSTSASTSATAANTAKVAAETARTAAQTAQTAAETARTAAQAAQTGAETAQTGAQTAQTAAAASATTATTQASNASTSATTATTKASEAATSASNASASATTATTQAGISTTKAGEAATSATNAATSATNAASSATSASTQATAAAGSATTASNAATTATTQAGIATTKAAEAVVSASDALTNKNLAQSAAATSTSQAASASASATSASASAASAAVSQGSASTSAVTSTAKASEAAASAAAVNAVYGSAASLQTAVQTAQAQASLAQGYAASASSVVQQDLSGITSQALHRSPNAVTSMFIYDTSKDSDGGAWTKKCQQTSWYNEALAGNWLGPQASEFEARAVGATLGSELVSNGDFSGGSTGWTLQTGWSIANGVASVNSAAGGTTNIISTGMTVTVGKIYRVTYTIVSVSGSGIRATLGGFAETNYRAIAGTYTIFVTATTTAGLSITASSTNTVATVDNISVREVTALNTASNDYFQLTTDGKFYRLWKNLIRYSAEFDNGWWVKDNVSVSANVTSAPDGSNTADALIENTASSTHTIAIAPVLATMPCTYSVYLKPNGRSWVRLFVFQSGITTNSVWFNVSTGAIGTTSAGASNISIVSAGNGWYRCSFTFLPVSYAAASAYVALANADGAASYTGDGTSGIYVWGAQLEYGSTVTTYEAKVADITTTEIFRGNKADFPKLAGIVAEAGNVNIYDLTEPGRPMWMRFVADPSNMVRDTITCCAANNGIMVAGASTRCMTSINFASESGFLFWTSQNFAGDYRGTVAQRNALVSYLQPSTRYGFVASTTINSVAMTVLPDAPMDPATGLRVPTIAVGTASGVSVIKHNGTVVNSSSTLGVGSLSFMGRSLVTNRDTTNSVVNIYNDVNNLTSSFTQSVQYQAANSVPRQSDGTIRMTSSPDRILLGRSLIAPGGATLIRPDRNNVTRALMSEIRNNFNTGWMTGDIRRTYMSDTTIGNLVDADLVSNTDFSSGQTGWNVSSASFTLTGDGWARVERTSAGFGTFSISRDVSAIVSGKWVRISYKLRNATATAVRAYVYNGTTVANICVTTPTQTAGTYTAYGYCPAGQTYSFGVISGGGNLGDVFEIDDLSIKETVGDVSYKAQIAPVTGTLSRAQLASGTSLVGYSGWSASNYLREPYSADLDFGTGEFTASAWVNVPATLPDASFPIIGSELIVNGDFASGTTGWTVPAGWTVASGVASVAGSNASLIASGSPVVASRIYRVEFDVSAYSTGTLYVRIGQGAALTTTGNGRKVFLLQATNTTGVEFYGGVPTLSLDNISVREVGPACIFDRAFSSGARIRLGVTGSGLLTAEAYDGTTTRTVTTTTAYNNATWLKARVRYTTDGSLAITVNGREVAATRGTPLLTMNNSSAVLTIGNSYALDAPFPGSIALLKLGATVPTTEQGLFMYEQEKQLFRAGALSVLPDSSTVLDLSYDDATDRWVAVSGTNESYWTGLVRNSVTAVPAGTYTRVIAASGVELVSRITANPGVDVSIPAYGLRSEMINKAEAAARLGKEPVIYDFVGGFTGNITTGSTAIASVAGLTYPTSYIGARISGTGIPTNATVVAVFGTTIYISAAATATTTGLSISFLDFILPAGMETKTVMSAGTVKQEGSTKDYTRLYDGFVETIRFGTAPGVTTWVQIQAQRSAS